MLGVEAVRKGSSYQNLSGSRGGDLGASGIWEMLITLNRRARDGKEAESSVFPVVLHPDDIYEAEPPRGQRPQSSPWRAWGFAVTGQ